MWGLLLAAALFLTWGHEVRRTDQDFLDRQALVVATMTAQLVAWGFLFSTLCRKALTAVCLTVVAPFVVALLTLGWGLADGRPEHQVWYFGLVLVVPLAGVSYVLTQHFDDGEGVWSEQEAGD